jgi:hypothetical protein
VVRTQIHDSSPATLEQALAGAPEQVALLAQAAADATAMMTAMMVMTITMTRQE